MLPYDTVAMIKRFASQKKKRREKNPSSRTIDVLEKVEY